MAARDPQLIGARIAKRRHQLGLTQIELAALLGVSPSSVADWERGASYPKRKLGKIEQVLGPLDDDEPAPSDGAEEALDRLQQQLDGLRKLLRERGQGNDEGGAGYARRAI
jgi:transcriptional regulator with XRE-family HTH domain